LKKTKKATKKKPKVIKKCLKCGVPLEGAKHKLHWFVTGVKPSEKKKGYCNKCEDKVKTKKKTKKRKKAKKKIANLQK